MFSIKDRIGKCDLSKFRMYDGSPIKEELFDAYLLRSYCCDLLSICRKMINFIGRDSSYYVTKLDLAKKNPSIDLKVQDLESLYEELRRDERIVAKLDDYLNGGKLRQSRVTAGICERILESREYLNCSKNRTVLNGIEFEDLTGDPNRPQSPEEMLLDMIFLPDDND